MKGIARLLYTDSMFELSIDKDFYLQDCVRNGLKEFKRIGFNLEANFEFQIHKAKDNNITLIEIITLTGTEALLLHIGYLIPRLKLEREENNVKYRRIIACKH